MCCVSPLGERQTFLQVETWQGQLDIEGGGVGERRIGGAEQLFFKERSGFVIVSLNNTECMSENRKFLTVVPTSILSSREVVTAVA